MPLPANQLENMIKEAFPDADIEIIDLAGDGDHYKAVIASAAFAGKTRVAQHKMVFDALGGIVGTTLHALALVTKAK